jgi:hypothetical protein
MRGLSDWGALAPLPRVSPFRRGVRTKSWEDQRDEWATAAKEPLVVFAELATPVVGLGALHLDGILSSAAMTLHPAPSSFDTAAVIPLPIELAWVSQDGLPLWAASDLTPAAEAARGAEYWHKRNPGHRADLGSRMNAVTTAGRWKEYRVPMQTAAVDRLFGLCVGALDEVERLLAAVTHVGKKGSIGYGRVGRWTVTPAGARSVDEIVAMRNAPVEYYAGRQPDGVVKPLASWTPPYWHAPWHRACIGPAA